MKVLFRFIFFWCAIFLSAWLLVLLSTPALHVSISFWRGVGIAYIIYIIGTLLNLDETVKEFKERLDKDDK